MVRFDILAFSELCCVYIMFSSFDLLIYLIFCCFHFCGVSVITLIITKQSYKVWWTDGQGRPGERGGDQTASFWQGGAPTPGRDALAQER